MQILESITNWYRGEYVPPPPNDPNSQLIFISPGHYEQPLLAKILGAIGQFWFAHWKWVIGTAIALAAIFVKFSGSAK